VIDVCSCQSNKLHHNVTVLARFVYLQSWLFLQKY
jgi:hypothetical protein